MLTPLLNGTFRRLFAAQVASLLGAGIMTVALALLAFEIAGENAGEVLGTALAVKMIAYVLVPTFANLFQGKLPNKILLVSLDLVRAGFALALPFVNEAWQIYLLIFLLQSASAAFTPLFQAIIPEILTEEEEYTKALSLSRLAYDLEGLISPVLAAALLLVMPFNALFAGTASGFLLSAALVGIGFVPDTARNRQSAGLSRMTEGLWKFFTIPRLRGLAWFNCSVAATGAMVIVNSVVIVRNGYGLGSPEVAIALAAFGAGSMLAALILPRVLKSVPDRTVMASGALLMTFSLLVISGLLAIGAPFVLVLVDWFVAGIGYSSVLTPAGRLLRRSAQPDRRPPLFTAQFTLSHLCWLFTYPIAGIAGSILGMSMTALLLMAISAIGAIGGIVTWRHAD